MAILVLQKNARFGGRVVDRQNDDGTGVPDDIAAGAKSARLFDLVGRDAENGST